MIIGSKSLDYAKLKDLCLKTSELVQYSDSLVPTELSTNRRILMNQRYFVALAIRKIQTLPYVIRKDACNTLLADVSVTGVLNAFFDYDDLLQHCDKDKLEKALKGGNGTEGD